MASMTDVSAGKGLLVPSQHAFQCTLRMPGMMMIRFCPFDLLIVKGILDSHSSQ